MSRTLLAALFLFLSALVASPQEKQDDLKVEASKMKKEVTKLRGLDFKSDVGVGLYTKEQLVKFTKEEFERELPRPKAKRYEKAYAHFGLIPAGLDLYDSLIVLFSESIAGFYDPRTKELKLIAGGEGGDNAEAKLMESVTLVHELTHAAQDQNFNLITVPMDEETNDDLVYAVKGLIEGEASAVGWQYGFPDTFDLMIKQINNSYKTGMLPGKANKLPAYLKETLTFPYGYGTDFVLACKKGYEGDWAKISKMYEDLPASSEQVLHPEKYWEKRDNPIGVTLPSLGDAWPVIVDNVQGEFVIRILLREFKIAKKEAEKAAAGWGGDRFHVYDRAGKVSSAWYTTWDTEDDAKEFFDSYRKALAKKYMKGEEAEATETKVRIDITLNTGTKLAVLLERRDKDVLVLDGEPDLLKTAPIFWDKTKKAEVTKVERFKEGKWTCAKHPKVEKEVNSYCPECGARLVAKEGGKKEKKDYR